MTLKLRAIYFVKHNARNKFEIYHASDENFYDYSEDHLLRLVLQVPTCVWRILKRQVFFNLATRKSLS